MKEIFDDQANDCSNQTSLQIELTFDIPTTDRLYTPHPHWDALENAHDPYRDTFQEETLTEGQNPCDTIDTSGKLLCGNSTDFALDDLRCAYNLGSAHQLCVSVGEQIFIDHRKIGDHVNVTADQLNNSAPQQYKSVGAQVLLATKTDISETSVGVQVTNRTEKFAPQHEKLAHWIEKYWVERAGNKYWYFRYRWMSGRKSNRVYLGSVRSRVAQTKVELVREAIAEGRSPSKIKQLIKGIMID